MSGRSVYVTLYKNDQCKGVKGWGAESPND